MPRIIGTSLSFRGRDKSLARFVLRVSLARKLVVLVGPLVYSCDYCAVDVGANRWRDLPLRVSLARNSVLGCSCDYCAVDVGANLWRDLPLPVSLARNSVLGCSCDYCAVDVRGDLMPHVFRTHL